MPQDETQLSRERGLTPAKHGHCLRIPLLSAHGAQTAAAVAGEPRRSPQLKVWSRSSVPHRGRMLAGGSIPELGLSRFLPQGKAFVPLPLLISKLCLSSPRHNSSNEGRETPEQSPAHFQTARVSLCQHGLCTVEKLSQSI